jgi:hypothetical protein
MRGKKLETGTHPNAGRSYVGRLTGAVMTRYVAKFTKNVLSDSGHESTIVQRTSDLEAPNREIARQLAEQRFCALEGIENWSSHADNVVIQEADFPS